MTAKEVSASFGSMTARVSVMYKELLVLKRSNKALEKDRDKYINKYSAAHDRVGVLESTNEVITDAIRHILVDAEENEGGLLVTQATIDKAKQAIGVI